MKRTMYAVAFSLACPNVASCTNQVDLPPQQIETVEQAFGTWQRVAGSGCFTDIAAWGSQLIGLGCVDVDGDHNRLIKLRRSDGSWIQFSGAAKAIASDGNALRAVAGNSSIWQWDNSAAQTWQPFVGQQGLGAPIPGAIAVYASVNYVIGLNSQVYQWRAHCNFSDCSASQWEPLESASGSVLRISTNSTFGVTVTVAGCGLNNVYRHPASPGVGWTSVGGAGIAGCFGTVTAELPASPNFEQYWGIRTNDGIPRQYNSATGFWDPKPLPTAAPYNIATRIAGTNSANRVYALGPTSDPQGNLWVNQ